MIVKLKIPDQVYERYERMAEEIQALSGNSLSPEELLLAQLERFAGVNPTDRVLLVTSRVRSKLENLLTGGSLADDQDLYKRVEDLASFKIGEVRMDFTPGQMKQLAAIAQRNRKSLNEVFKETVKQIEWKFFDEVHS